MRPKSMGGRAVIHRGTRDRMSSDADQSAARRRKRSRLWPILIGARCTISLLNFWLFAAAALLSGTGLVRAQGSVWNDYAGSSSVFVPYAGYTSVLQNNQFPGLPQLELDVKAPSGGGSRLTLSSATMDTGSTGLVISLQQACTSFLSCTGTSAQNYVPSSSAVLGYSTVTYTSSNTTYFGFYTNAKVTVGGDKATADVPIFVAISTAGQSQQAAAAPGNLGQFGIGFGRGNADGIALTDANGQPNGTTLYGKNLNAFMNLTSLKGVSNLSAVAPGYVVTSTGVYLGLSQGAVGAINGTLLALTPSPQSPGSSVSAYAAAATKNDWQTPPMVLRVTGNTSPAGINGQYYGKMLVDTGINDAILTTGGKGTNAALVTSPTPTNMTIGLPGISTTNGAVQNQFTYVYQGTCKNASQYHAGCGPASPMAPYSGQNSQIIPIYPISSKDSAVNGYDGNNTGFADASATAAFLNTGVNFLSYFNVVYDPVSGFIGYLPNGSSAGTSGLLSVTPMFALQGSQVIPDGTNVNLPIYLFTAIGNQAQPVYAPVDVVLSAASPSGQVTISQPISSDVIFNCALVNCSTGLVINQGTFLFDAPNTYAGTTTINPNATLALGPNGSIASSFGVTTNGTFDISQTASGASIKSLSGHGVVALGAQTLTLTDAQGIFAGTIVDGGLGGGSGGGLAVTGGKEILTGDSTYSGPTSITRAVLEVDGSIGNTSGVTVNAGGILSGTGLIDPTTTTIMDGGTLAPGSTADPTGKLTIIGNLVFQSAATYLVTVSGASASNTQLNGTASLDGTVQALFASGATTNSYNILHFASRTVTTFSGAASLNPNYSVSLSYTPTDVLLGVSAQLGAGSGLNRNQLSVANAISSVFNSAGTLPTSLVNLFTLTGGNLGSALSQLDGEAATGAQRSAFQMMSQFLTLTLDPFVDGRRGRVDEAGTGAIGFSPEQEGNLPPEIALAYAAVLTKAQPKPIFEQRWTAWGSAYGAASNANGNATTGSNSVAASTFGFAGGMDYHFTPDTVGGFALAGAGGNWGLANALGSGRSDAFQAGAYGVNWFGRAYVAAALAFANHWFSTRRGALGDQLTASFIGQSYGARLEGGYRYAMLPALGVTPYTALQVQAFHTPAYSEADVTGGGLGLSYAAMNATDVRSEIGARFDDRTLLFGKPLVLFGRLAWAHDFVSNPTLSAGFEALPGGTFTVNGAPIAHDSMLTTGGTQLFLAPQWTLLAKFEGEFATGSQTYAGTGTLRYAW